MLAGPFGQGMKVNIRKASLEDASRIAEIYVFSWRNTYKSFISNQYLFNNLCVSKKIDFFNKLINKNNIEVLVYEEDKIVKAFMTIGKCENTDKNNAFALWDIYVDPSFMNRGIGNNMILYFENHATMSKYKETVIWVFEKNKNAIMFYEKHGYKNDGAEEYIERFKEKEIRYTKQILGCS